MVSTTGTLTTITTLITVHQYLAVRLVHAKALSQFRLADGFEQFKDIFLHSQRPANHYYTVYHQRIDDEVSIAVEQVTDVLPVAFPRIRYV